VLRCQYTQLFSSCHDVLFTKVMTFLFPSTLFPVLSPLLLTSETQLTCFHHSYIPLLLLPLPLSLSPIHLTTLFALTYILNRPCIYCSLLLLILFASSCHWSGRCFIDFGEGHKEFASWWIPRLYTTSAGLNSSLGYSGGNSTDIANFIREVSNTTVAAFANAAIQGLKNRVAGTPEMMETRISNATGIGLGWIKSLLGRSEWTMPCTQYQIAL
jgi:hypothetical protein